MAEDEQMEAQEGRDVQETQEDGVDVYFEGKPPEGVPMEELLEVEAKATISEDEYKVARGYYRFGKSLSQAVELFGEEVVFTNFRAQSKIRLQAIMRSYIKKNQDVDKLLVTWKPGVQLERVPIDSLVAAENAFAGMNQEEQEAFLQRLMERRAQ